MVSALTLGAAPTDALVLLLSPEEKAAAQRAFEETLEPGRGRGDATGTWLGLHAPPGVLDFQDFTGFTMAPSRAWPKALEAAWVDGVAHCRQVSGPPPWRESTRLTEARCCGQRLGRLLWEKLLAEQGFTDVYVLRSEGKETVTVTGTRAAVRGDEQWVVTREGPQADGPRLTAEVVRALVAKEGAPKPRQRIEALYTPLAVDPWTAAAPPESPVRGMKTCAQLPSALSVTPASATAKHLAARWQATVKGAAPALACTLRFSEHREPDAENQLVDGPVVTTLLTCGDTAVATDLLRAPLPPKALDTVTARLVTRLAARLCP